MEPQTVMEQVFGKITPGMLLVLIPSMIEVVRKIKDKEPWTWKTLASLGLGLLFGGGLHLVEVYQSGAVVDFPVYFAAVIYGLLIGLVPVGLYSIGTRFAQGQVGRSLLSGQIRKQQESMRHK